MEQVVKPGKTLRIIKTVLESPLFEKRQGANHSPLLEKPGLHRVITEEKQIDIIYW